MLLSCKVVEKGGFGAPGLYGEGIPKISDMRFQIALTSEPSTWPVLDEFRSASSKGRCRKKKKKISVKPKSGDDCVGRPRNIYRMTNVHAYNSATMAKEHKVIVIGLHVWRAKVAFLLSTAVFCRYL